ncbi:MAG: type II secretion system protein [Proteobacteria bacterium]|nr:type II secretion system protein [Pseudomonadota bacterium]
MPRGSGRGPRRQRGFTYLGLLALVVLIGVLLAAAGQVASTNAQREREQELLYVGHEYRAAIGRYLKANGRYPTELKDLLSPGTGPLPVRYIRHLYRDPMTNAVDWRLVPADGGGFIGVASSSTRTPLKQAGFDPVDAGFEKAQAYGDWEFTFLPTAHRPVAPGAAPGVTGVTNP